MSRKAGILELLKEVGGAMELCCNDRVVEDGGLRVRQADVDPANRRLLDETGIKQWTELRMILEQLERGDAIQTVQREISQTMEVRITDEGRRMAEALKHGEEILSETCRVNNYRRKYDKIDLDVPLMDGGTKSLASDGEGGQRYLDNRTERQRKNNTGQQNCSTMAGKRQVKLPW